MTHQQVLNIYNSNAYAFTGRKDPALWGTRGEKLAGKQPGGQGSQSFEALLRKKMAEKTGHLTRH